MTFSCIRLSELISLFCAFCPVLTVFPIVGRGFSISLFAVTLPIAEVILVNFPVGDEKCYPTLAFALMSAAVEIAYLMTTMEVRLLYLLLDMLVLAIVAIRFYERYFCVRRLFRVIDFWNVMLFISRLMLLAILNVQKAVVLAIFGNPLGVYVLTAVEAFTYAFLLYWSRTGHFIMIGERKEKELRALMKAYSETVASPHDPEKMKNSKESELMLRVYRVMEEDRPYLDETFSIHNLASMVYTNKTTLSKAINTASGMNFCQFVNDYRIRYAVELMTKEPKLKVFELSERSGFHNQVTFGMAFKMKMGVTPGEYSLLKRSQQLCVPVSSVPDE